MNPDRPVFSLKAFLLAPIPVPLVASALFVPGMSRPFGLFLMVFPIGLLIAYLGTAALVASLWIIARARPVTKIATTLTGGVLAAIGYLPIIFLNWRSSGPDSGPPLETFGAYLLRNWSDGFLYVFLVGGLVTALLYDTLARRPRSRPVNQPSAGEGRAGRSG